MLAGAPGPTNFSAGALVPTSFMAWGVNDIFLKHFGTIDGREHHTFAGARFVF